jgi:dethiobiotin synthetase
VSIIIVTGTGTDVGKTVATAALATCAGGHVVVVKPAQTGVHPGEPGDLAEVTRLSGCGDVVEFARYPDPLSPAAAARRSGLPTLDRDDVARWITNLDNEFDLVLVEGAGGLLVEYAQDGWTMLDLGRALGADFVLVTSPGLGTLNHTALTLRTLGAETPTSLIIGSWPASPGLAELCNVHDLCRMDAVTLVGALPEGMGGMADFASRSRAALAPEFGGTFDAQAFRSQAYEQESTWPTSSR